MGSSGGKAKKFCTSCGCGDDPTGFPTPSPPVDPTGVPTPSPPDDECKGGKDEIDLENKGTRTCKKIEEKKWCDEKVVGGGKAKKFCTSCGCGDDPTGFPPPSPPVDPTGVPTPSPPDDECKGGKDEIDLENKGTRTCKKIEEKKWCDEKVVGGGKAKKFCTSCGCGDDPTGAPVATGVPTPSPP